VTEAFRNTRLATFLSLRGRSRSPGVYEVENICISVFNCGVCDVTMIFPKPLANEAKWGISKRLAFFQDDVGLGIGAETLFLDVSVYLPRRQQVNVYSPFRLSFPGA